MREATAGKLFGLFIGANRYESEDIAPLSFAAADVRALRESLIQGFGMVPTNAVLLIDEEAVGATTRRQILRAMDRFGSAPIAEDDAFVFAFAGHGFHCEGRTYLAAGDSEISSEALLRETAVAVDTVRTFLDRIPARQQILILDCCRNNPVKGTRSIGTTAMTGDMTRDIGALVCSSVSATLPTWRAHAVLCSCWEGQVAHDYEAGGHGWFCHNLLAELAAQSGGELSLSELHRRVKDRMRETSWPLLPRAKDQTPHLLIDGDVPVLRPAAAGAMPTDEANTAMQPASPVERQPSHGPASVTAAGGPSRESLGTATALEADLTRGQPRAVLQSVAAMAAPSPRARVLGCLAQLMVSPIPGLRNAVAGELAARLGELACTDQHPLATLLLATLEEHYYRPLKRRFPLPNLVASAQEAVRDLSQGDVLLVAMQPQIASTFARLTEHSQ